MTQKAGQGRLPGGGTRGGGQTEKHLPDGGIPQKRRAVGFNWILLLHVLKTVTLFILFFTSFLGPKYYFIEEDCREGCSG